MSDNYEELLAQAFGPNPKAPSETKAVVATDKPAQSLEEALVTAISDAVRRVLRERGLS